LEVVKAVVDAFADSRVRTKASPRTFVFLFLFLLVRSHSLTRLNYTWNLSFATQQIGYSSSSVVVKITVNSLLTSVPKFADAWSHSKCR
jgi:hypothetical protein